MPTLSKALRLALPYGACRVLDNMGRLRCAGVSGPLALRRAVSFSGVRALRTALVKHLPPGSFENPGAVIDVGANRGDWTAAVLQLCRPTRALVIEPDPRLSDELRRRFKHHSAVDIHTVAVGRSPGMATFNLLADTRGSSLRDPRPEMNGLYGGGYDVVSTVSASILTLDELTASIPRVSLLKIDAQGAENEILEGAHDTLKKTKVVTVEANFYSHYVGDTVFGDLHAIMSSFQFDLYDFTSPMRIENRAMWCDAVYVMRA